MVPFETGGRSVEQFDIVCPHLYAEPKSISISRREEYATGKPT
jgi:hypothetical protein